MTIPDKKYLRMIAVISYARKVAENPKGSLGYDPVDMMNLQGAFDKLDKSEWIRSKK